jgi:hypothetical protein
MARVHSTSQRYAMLAASRPDHDDGWPPEAARTEVVDALELSAGAERARASIETSETARDGRRTMAKTAARIAARDAAAAQRNALDWQRLEDLQARYDQRQALALKRRWFVLGRLIDEAMANDEQFRAAVLAMLRTAATRRDDRDALGLDPER